MEPSCIFPQKKEEKVINSIRMVNCYKLSYYVNNLLVYYLIVLVVIT